MKEGLYKLPSGEVITWSEVVARYAHRLKNLDSYYQISSTAQVSDRGKLKRSKIRLTGGYILQINKTFQTKKSAEAWIKSEGTALYEKELATCKSAYEPFKVEQ